MIEGSPGQPLVEPLAWDSAFFGFSVARIHGDRPSAGDLSAAIAECRGQGIVCAYLLCDAEAVESVTLAVRNGFRFVDLRVVLDWKPASALSEVAEARSATSADLPDLIHLAEGAFKHSRFFVDQSFPRERAEALFTRWIARDLESEEGLVTVVEQDGRVAAFASALQLADGGARIGLVGVDPQLRGRGLGRRVVTVLLSLLSARGVGKVEVVTQGRNSGALRLYEDCGFRTSSVGVWLHWWSA